jgi:hypothetical protein
MSRAQPYDEVLAERDRFRDELNAQYERAIEALLEVKDRDLCSRPGDLPGGEIFYSGDAVIAAEILDVEVEFLVRRVRAARRAKR